MDDIVTTGLEGRKKSNIVTTEISKFLSFLAVYCDVTNCAVREVCKKLNAHFAFPA